MKFITQIKEKQEQIKTIRRELNDICDKITKTIEKNITDQQTNKYTAYTVRHTEGFCFIISLEIPTKTDLSNLIHVNKSFNKIKFHFFGPSEDIDPIMQICKETLKSSQQ